MLRDITLGQYLETGSPIHRLDPRTKLLATILYLVAVFVADNAWGLLFCAFFMLLLMRIAKIPAGYVFRGFKGIIILLIFTVLLNLFLQDGTVLVSFWKLKITWEGVYNALLIFSRLLLLVCGSSLLTLTTTPLSLADALESLMSPLKKIKFPVHEIALMLSIALRFIPVLLTETDRIMKAQKVRGVDFEHGSLVARIKNMIPIFVPLLVSLFRRSDELAMAMESRLYRADGVRTKMNELHMKRADWLALSLMLVFLGAGIALSFLPTAVSLVAGLCGVSL